MENGKLEAICACTLNRVFGYEPRIAHGIINNFGNARSFFNLSPSERRATLAGHANQADKLDDYALELSEKELDSLSRYGARFTHISQEHYPNLLKECDDAPVGLYIRSDDDDAAIFNRRPAVAIVGTRDISLYGKEWTRRICSIMSQSSTPPVIVSGLAMGVDINAHIAALEFGLPTIAVSPTGIDSIYPQRHRSAAMRISQTPGSAIITDYPPGTNPAAFTFIRRNRIIAGLSDSTILIESKAHGGGLITARLADGYGREVFALPGRIDDLRSEGCNNLIKENVAQIISSPESLCADLGLGIFNRKSKTDLGSEISTRYKESADCENLKVTALLIKERRGITPEEIGDETGLGYHEALRLVCILERDGFISTDLLQRCCIECKNC